MVWICVDKDGQELIFDEEPIRIENHGIWGSSGYIANIGSIDLPKGSIKKLIGRDLTWEDEPVLLKEEDYER